MDNIYCYKKCKKGMQVCKDLLRKSDSVFDAASDFELFVENCAKTCPHKEQIFSKEELRT